MSKVTVYTKPNCPKCEDTKNLLNELGIEYSTVDILENPEARVMLKNEGYKMMPVVKADGHGEWSGFDRNKIESLLKEENENEDDLWG